MEYLGLLIKSERLGQEISQEALCHGICSTSYLSKIENANTVASEEIYDLLFKRLGITYYAEEEVSAVKFKIEQFYHNLLFRIKQDTSVLLEELEIYLYSPLYLFIEITKCYIKFQNKEESNYQKLKEFNTFFSTQENYYYTLLCSFYESDAIVAIKMLSPLLLDKNDGLVMEEIASRYYRFGEYSLAIQYGEKAFHQYSLQGNIESMADVVGLIANSYLNLENLTHAKQWFETLENLNNTIKSDNLRYSIQYNLGASYLVNQDYQQAEYHLEQAYKCILQIEVSESTIFNTYQKLCLTKIELNKQIEAKQYLQEYLKTNSVPKDYQQDYELLEYKVNQKEYYKEKKYLELLEATYQMSKKRKHHGNLKYYAKELIEAYQQNRMYKQAAELASEYAFPELKK